MQPAALAGMLPEGGQRGVDTDRLRREQGILFAVLRHQSNAGPNRIPRTADDHGAALHQNLAAVPGLRAEDGAQSFRAAGADQPGQAKNFPAPGLEADVAHAAARAQMPHAQRDFSAGGTPAIPSLRQIMARHFPDQLRGLHLSGVMGGNAPSVAHHGDAAGHAANFIHAMADVNNAHPFGLQAADVFKKPLYLRVGKRRSRLVQNEQPAIPRQGARDLDQLLMADAELAGRGRRIKIVQPDTRQGLEPPFPAIPRNAPSRRAAAAG